MRFRSISPVKVARLALRGGLSQVTTLHEVELLALRRAKEARLSDGFAAAKALVLKLVSPSAREDAGKVVAARQRPPYRPPHWA